MKKQTVRDYAEENYISRQAVYKKIDKGTLKTMKENIDGKEVIFILIDEDPTEESNLTNSTPIQPQDNQETTQKQDETTPNSTPIQPQDNQETTPNSTSIQPSIQPYIEMIDLLKQELADRKDELKDRDRTIETLTRLLDQEQHLHAQTRLLLKGYQDREEAETPKEESQEEPTINEKPIADQEQKKKKSWFRRWFFGED